MKEIIRNLKSPERAKHMKILYGGREWEWKYGSYEELARMQLISPDEKNFLNGNGSGLCLMRKVKEIPIPEEFLKSQKEKLEEISILKNFANTQKSP